MQFEGMSAMEQRQAFVAAARGERANVRELCRGFTISPATGYKWLGQAGGRRGGVLRALAPPASLAPGRRQRRSWRRRYPGGPPLQQAALNQISRPL